MERTTICCQRVHADQVSVCPIIANVLCTVVTNQRACVRSRKAVVRGMSGPIRAILAIAVMVLGTVQAAACSRPSVSGAEAAIASPARINQTLIDAAIRAEVNYHRCKAGLPPVDASGGLARVAGTHAKWMARARSLSHKSTTAGQATAMARLRSSGVRFRAGSENIGYLARFRIDGLSFKIKNAATCEFATDSGQRLGAHSYATLAQKIVELWMNSQAHRRNILDRKVRKVGSGAGFDAKAPYCGSFYVSQTFAG